MSDHRTVASGLARGLTAALVVALLSTAPYGIARAESTTRVFTVVNIDYEGSKIWVPATLVVEEGDKVQIKLINNVPTDPNQHGFAIPAFNVSAVVTRGTPETVEFVADKRGVHDIACHLHPAHVAGQLVVLDGD